MSSVNPQKIAMYAQEFESFCSDALVKVAYIRKRDGKYVILSEKGKVLGTYDTKEQAVVRLRQIEYFKHHKKTKKKASKDDSYSSIVRDLRKSSDEETVKCFQEEFKKTFDQALIDGNEEPEKIALEKAIQTIEKEAQIKNELMEKIGSAIDLGDPEAAGKYLSDMIRFLTKRISPERRPKALDSLKRKIYYINEFDIAGKKTPPSSSMGQSITLLKTILLEHSSDYIRKVLNAIVKSL